jgi:hypothetical protein
VVIATDPAGVVWRGGETSNAGEPVGGLERAQVAVGVRDERHCEHGTEVGHAELAGQIAAIDAEIARLDARICERFDQHPDAPILLPAVCCDDPLNPADADPPRSPS